MWVQESDYIGQRPVCDSSIDVTKGKNYRYQTLEKCKEACMSTARCDTISRFEYTGKTDSSLWHCWFYACGSQPSNTWEPQTSWGHGANKAVTYFLYTRGKQSAKVINETRYVDRIVNKTRYINQIVNKTRYIDKIRWTNRTVDQIVNKTRYIDKTRYVDVFVNKTRYIDKIRWTNRTVDQIVNKTRYIDKTRYVDVFVNKTVYEDTIGPALLPEASADVSETPDVESNESSDDCAQWDTRDYVLILIIAVIAVAWCLKQTFEFFECRMPSKNAPATEEEIFPDAELPPMAWEVKVDDIVKD